MSVEDAVNRLDRGQRDRLHQMALALHLSSEFSDVFGELMDVVTVSDSLEAYVGHHVNRQVWSWPPDELALPR